MRRSLTSQDRLNTMDPANTTIHRRVAEAQQGRNPALVARMASGWAVMSDTQVTKGYCLLLPDPVVKDLNELKDEARAQFLADMAVLGDAVLAATGAMRINYEILGNLDPALHAHVIPRFADEPGELRTKPIWFYDMESAPRFDPESDKGLVESIRLALEKQAEKVTDLF
jgi:diadenosine tetraphosphate (Ap4A) HIT family hydrolase